jgi:hypothetical protein
MSETNITVCPKGSRAGRLPSLEDYDRRGQQMYTNIRWQRLCKRPTAADDREQDQEQIEDMSDD